MSCEHEKTLSVLLYKQDDEGRPLFIEGKVCLNCQEELI